MLELALTIFLYGLLVNMSIMTALCVCIVTYLPNAFPKILSVLENMSFGIPYGSERFQEERTAGISTARDGSGEVKVEVPDLPPEAIAPSLSKPPRPQGGFGSRVSKDDDST